MGRSSHRRRAAARGVLSGGRGWQRERRGEVERNSMIVLRPGRPRASLRALEIELHQQRLTLVRRIELIARYARLNADGHVVRCTPGPTEAFTAPSVGKVVYNTERAAEASAHAFDQASGRVEPKMAYRCGRGERVNQWHWHLTTRPTEVDQRTVPGRDVAPTDDRLVDRDD